jgi:hypothetical protein
VVIGFRGRRLSPDVQSLSPGEKKGPKNVSLRQSHDIALLRRDVTVMIGQLRGPEGLFAALVGREI